MKLDKYNRAYYERPHIERTEELIDETHFLWKHKTANTFVLRVLLGCRLSTKEENWEVQAAAKQTTEAASLNAIG